MCLLRLIIVGAGWFQDVEGRIDLPCDFGGGSFSHTLLSDITQTHIIYSSMSTFPSSFSQRRMWGHILKRA